LVQIKFIIAIHDFGPDYTIQYTSPNYTDNPQVNIRCIENFFTVQDFLATCACPEIFHSIEYIFHTQDF